jgi:hypothetical protein
MADGLSPDKLVSHRLRGIDRSLDRGNTLITMDGHKTGLAYRMPDVVDLKLGHVVGRNVNK